MASGAVSTPGLFSLINQFQMFMLLGVLKSFIHKDVKDYLSGMKIFNFSFNFFEMKNIPVFSNLYEFFNINQNEVYLSSIGLNSQSAFLNNLNLFFVLIILILIHICYYPFHLILKKCQKMSKCRNIIFYFKYLN